MQKNEKLHNMQPQFSKEILINILTKCQQNKFSPSCRAGNKYLCNYHSKRTTKLILFLFLGHENSVVL